MTTQSQDTTGPRRVYLVVDQSAIVDGPERGETKLDLKPLANRIVANKFVIVGSTALGLLLGGMVALLLPKHFSSTVKLLPPQQAPSSSLLMSPEPVTGLAGLQKSIGLKDPNEIYLGILKSRVVEDALIQKFHLMTAYHSRDFWGARKTLEERTNIETDKDGLFVIDVVDTNKQRAADLANEYVEQLRRVTQEVATTEAARRRLFYQQQLLQAKDDLAAAESHLAATQQRKGILEPDLEARDLVQSLATLRAQATTKRAELAALRARYTNENILVKSAQGQVDTIDAQLSHLQESAPTGSNGSSFDLALKDVPQAAVEYVRAARDVKFREAVFQLFLKQYEAASIDEAQNALTLQIIEPAVPAERKSSPNVMLILAGSAFAGFIIGILLILRPATADGRGREGQHRFPTVLARWHASGLGGR